MSVLDVVKRGVSGLATVAGKGLEGYGQDQQIDNARVMAALKSAREGENDRVTNLVKQKELARVQPGDQGYGAYKADEIRTTGPAQTEQAVGAAAALAPIQTQQAIDTARGIAPVTIDTHKAERTFDNANPAPVPASFAFPTGEDASGKPVVLRANTKTGEVSPTGQAAKSPVTKVESATNTAAKARMSAAISEMNNANAGMGEFEEGLRTGRIKIGMGGQLLARSANAFTHDDPASQIIQGTTLATLNKTDPELARYVRRALSFAEGESMISNRPSDFRTKMSAFLSAAASGATPDMIADIQSRRHSILTPLNEINQSGPSASPAPAAASSPGTGKPAISAAEAAQLKSHGFTDQQIAAKYSIGH